MRSKSVSPVSCGKGTRYSQPHDEGRLIVRLLRRGRTVRFGLQGTLLRREADSGKKGANGAPKRGRRWSFWSGRDLARWRPLRGRVRAFATSGGTDIARASLPAAKGRRVVLATRVGSRGITDSYALRARPLGFASLTTRGSWHPPL